MCLFGVRKPHVKMLCGCDILTLRDVSVDCKGSKDLRIPLHFAEILTETALKFKIPE